MGTGTALPKVADNCRTTVGRLAAHTLGVGAGAVGPVRLPLRQMEGSPGPLSSVDRLNLSSRKWPLGALANGSVRRWTMPNQNKKTSLR